MVTLEFLDSIPHRFYKNEGIIIADKDVSRPYKC